ncbi:MAG TPA: alpha-galactosidase [Nocardioidaceae bacterium]|nr:alpha-galactosidase [Nocardioidaceae bacterium]
MRQAIDPFYQRAAGTSLLLAVCANGSGADVPVLVHWGADLGELDDEDIAEFVIARSPSVPHSALDEPRLLAVVPDSASGFTGTPAVEGFRVDQQGAAWAPKFNTWLAGGQDPSGPAAEDSPSQIGPRGGNGIELVAEDVEAGLAVNCFLALSEEGMLHTRTVLTNTGTSDFVLTAVRSALPVGAEAGEILDLTGRWCRERSPQRRAFTQGTWQRAGRHGRTGHDATLMMVAGTPSFGFRNGTVWGIHLAWSGDHLHYAERTPEGESLLGGGELLGPGEVVLAPRESYQTPWLMGAWSDKGMDGLSERFHRWVRDATPRSRAPRPVVVNTWEAVYFDHDLARLTALADAAAEVGAERFVLDDGWFAGRRSDSSGLGDWTVDAALWPQGLHPIVDHVRGLGMDFGLWVEPEMVNADSDLAREHPDWVLKGRTVLPGDWRHQQVLDLQNEDAFRHLHRALLALLDEYDISFLKWDHNRDLIDVARGGRPAVHGQTLAFYRLLDELRAAYPGLEIESCASGGGRVDLEVLRRTHRIWPSDTVDPLERQHIQRWTSLLVPPELVGAHIGGPVAHTTGRRHRLGFRAATALLGHLGIEWDLCTASVEERVELAAWIALHKELRALVATGVVVRADHPDPALLVSGVVAADASEAVFVIAAVASTRTQAPVPVQLPGLDPTRRYEVTRVGPAEGGPLVDLGNSWLTEPHVLTGSALTFAGVRLPVQAPESAVVLRLSGR